MMSQGVMWLMAGVWYAIMLIAVRSPRVCPSDDPAERCVVWVFSPFLIPVILLIEGGRLVFGGKSRKGQRRLTVEEMRAIGLIE